jgi:hypothetical protein
MRGDVLARRDQWQATPRAADLAMAGLSEVEQRQAHGFERLGLEVPALPPSPAPASSPRNWHAENALGEECWASPVELCDHFGRSNHRRKGTLLANQSGISWPRASERAAR